MYCRHCKIVINKKANYCPYCGNKLIEETDEIREEIKKLQAASEYEVADQHTEKTEMKNSTAAFVSYLTVVGIGIIFLKVNYDDSLVKFHLNQSIVLNAILLISMFLPLPDFLEDLIFILYLGASIYGIYEAVNEKQNGIPYINRIKFVK